MQQDHGKSSTPVGRKCRAQIVCGALPIRNRKNKVQTSNDATPLMLGRWIVLLNTLVMLQQPRDLVQPLHFGTRYSGDTGSGNLGFVIVAMILHSHKYCIRSSNVEIFFKGDFNLHWGKCQTKPDFCPLPVVVFDLK